MSINYNTFAFIPARKNSKRIKNKNIYNLNGHPLLAYTVENAIKSNCFKKIYCITDDLKYANIAKKFKLLEIPRHLECCRELLKDLEKC